MSNYFIYALVDPSNFQIRYVGQTKRPKTRYQGHLNSKENFEKYKWIRNLIAKNQRPLLVILEYLVGPTSLKLGERELFHAKQAIAEGNKIFNHPKFTK